MQKNTGKQREKLICVNEEFQHYFIIDCIEDTLNLPSEKHKKRGRSANKTTTRNNTGSQYFLNKLHIVNQLVYFLKGRSNC